MYSFAVNNPVKTELHLENNFGYPTVRWVVDNKLSVFRWVGDKWIKREESNQLSEKDAEIERLKEALRINEQGPYKDTVSMTQ